MSRSKGMIFRKRLFRNDQSSGLAWTWRTVKLTGTLQLGKGWPGGIISKVCKIMNSMKNRERIGALCCPL